MSLWLSADELIELTGYRLRALGNAVVPQIPEIIGRAIMRAAGSDTAQRIQEGEK